MLYYVLMIGTNLLLTVLFYKFQNAKKLSHIPYFVKQIFIGLVFGFMGIVATLKVNMLSVPLSNVRDSFTVTAGLLFSGEAGIVSSIVSASFRFFSPLLKGGEFTRISCTVTTLAAGILSAVMRQFFFKKKCPTLVLSFLFSICIEALHMAMIFLTHSNNLTDAFYVVKGACFKVMLANSISVMLCIFVVRLFDFKAFKKLYVERGRQKGVNRGLIAALGFFLILAFILVGYFLYFTHTRFSENSLKYVFDGYIMEVKDKVDSYGKDVTEMDIINEVDHYYAYMIDEILLTDRLSNYIYNEREWKDKVQYFPIQKGLEEGVLNTVDIGGEYYYYMYRPYGKYNVVAICLRDDITFFRDSTIYMVALLNVIIFSTLFFVTYILLKTYVIGNLRRVIEQTMKAKGEVIKEEHIITTKYFTPITEELNYTFRLLYKNNTELTGKMREEHEKKEAFEYLADHDKLTGIFNREGFRKKVKCVCCENKNIAFIFIDVDKFKEVNDTYGHQVGDNILQKITREIGNNSRSDDIPMRYGGDEFALILMGCTEKEKRMITHKIKAINDSLSDTSDGLPFISISAGCAFSEVGYSQELLVEADKALYVSKQNGRARCSFSDIVIR